MAIWLILSVFCFVPLINCVMCFRWRQLSPEKYSIFVPFDPFLIGLTLKYHDFTQTKERRFYFHDQRQIIHLRWLTEVKNSFIAATDSFSYCPLTLKISICAQYCIKIYDCNDVVEVDFYLRDFFHFLTHQRYVKNQIEFPITQSFWLA